MIALAACGDAGQRATTVDGSTTTAAGPTVTIRPDSEPVPDEEPDEVPVDEASAAEAPGGALDAEAAAAGWVRSAVTIEEGQSYAEVAQRTATWVAPRSPAATGDEVVRGEAGHDVEVLGLRIARVDRRAGETTVWVTIEASRAPQLRTYEVITIEVETGRWLVARAEARP